MISHIYPSEIKAQRKKYNNYKVNKQKNLSLSKI